MKMKSGTMKDTKSFAGYHTSKDGKKYVGVTNVGNNPTFKDATKRLIQVEAHILDFDKFIYGEDLRIEFLEYIRGEKKFSGIEIKILKKWT